MKIGLQIVGNYYRGKAEQAALQNMQPGEPLILQREPSNQFDPNAIRVETPSGLHLGYIPATAASHLAMQMDQDEIENISGHYENGQVMINDTA